MSQPCVGSVMLVGLCLALQQWDSSAPNFSFPSAPDKVAKSAPLSSVTRIAEEWVGHRKCFLDDGLARWRCCRLGIGRLFEHMSPLVSLCGMERGTPFGVCLVEVSVARLLEEEVGLDSDLVTNFVCLAVMWHLGLLSSRTSAEEDRCLGCMDETWCTFLRPLWSP